MDKHKVTPTMEQAAPNKYSPSAMMVVKLANNKPPDFVEKQGKDWVYFGRKNEYPNYLLGLFNQSAKHNAIVYQKAYYIAGGGFVGEVGKTMVNAEEETLDEIAKKSVLDYEIFGGFCLEVIWNKGGGGFEFRHVDFSNIRSNPDNTEFYYTKKWIKKYDHNNDIFINSKPQEEEDFETYPAFDGINKKGKQLFYFKSYRPGLDVYPLPEYMGAISYIELDYQIANYWYNAVKYGFAPSHIINFFNGVPSPEEQKKLEQEIKDKFTGTDNAGKFILNFSDSKETGGSEIQNITPADLDKQFNILNATIQEEIFSGHRITSPMLMGIKTPGQLGGRTELIDANELFQNIYVKPKQAIIEKAFGELMIFKGVKEALKLNAIEPIGLDLINSPEGWAVLSETEKREEVGKEPLPADETIQENSLLTLLNKVSDNVGAKILESLTINEARGLAGLSAVAGGDIVAGAKPNPPQVTTTPPAVLPTPELPKIPSINSKMTSEQVIDLFKKAGKASGKRLAHRNMAEIEFGKLEDNEREYVGKFLDPNLKPTELSVLDLLQKNPLMTAEEIAKVLKTDTKTVKNAIGNLMDKNLISEEKTKDGVTLTPVKDATKILNETPAPTEQIYVKYSYDWRKDVPEDRRNTKEHPSRDFCVQLMEMSKQGMLWSREDIQNIASQSGLDVWSSRGGWFTIPGTDIHRPSCRHLWNQHIIHEAK